MQDKEFTSAPRGQQNPSRGASSLKEFLTRRQSFLGERIMEKLVMVAGISSVIIIALIFFFLLKEAIFFFKTANPVWLVGRLVYDDWDEKHIFNMMWQTVSEIPKYSIIPLICGSFLVSFPATIMAAIFGIGSAVYLSEIASNKVRETLKPSLELLASMPSVVIGFIMLAFGASILQDIFHTKFRLNAFVGAIGVAITTFPIITTLAEDALRAVPKELRNASYALGATKWQTIIGTTIPAAVSGLAAAVILGFGRALGETMIVIMATGNAGIITLNMFSSVRTMTATIAQELGEVAEGSEHYYVLFVVGAILFVFTFILNLYAEGVLHKMRKQLRAS